MRRFSFYSKSREPLGQKRRAPLHASRGLAILILAVFCARITAADRIPLPRNAWTFHTQATPPNACTAHIAAFEATPVLAGNLLYVITPFNQVIALDPGAGTEKWRFDPHIARDRAYSEASARGVTVANGAIFFGTLDARLVSLRASDGKLLWDVEITPGVRDGNYQVTSPPVVVGNMVVVGSAIGDNGRAEMERGTVRAFDAASGRMKWTWDPHSSGQNRGSKCLGADVCRSRARSDFCSHRQRVTRFYGGLRPGNDLYANCVIALRASTGRLVWSFQVVHHDLWDYDVASRPLLINVGSRPAIGVLTKIGHYFALDRLTGAPLLPVDEKPAPQSDIDGESASATQPVPRSGVFNGQKFVPRPGWCEAEFNKLRYEGLFTPPSLKGSLVFPGNIGGANWGGGVYDAARGLIYVAANRLATSVRLIPRETFDQGGHGDTGERIGREYGRQ